MRAPEADEITRLLRAAHDGQQGALEELLPRLYGELHDLAHRLLRKERPGHTLQTTALVHEAWLRLVRQDTVGFEHRHQFFSMAASTMRRILVDHARSLRREKRGAGVKPRPLDETVAALERNIGDLLDLESALGSLEEFSPRKVRLVELRFFVGLSTVEAAETLGISERQAERDWNLARAWLKRRLFPPDARPA